jgi:hypothetical protein
MNTARGERTDFDTCMAVSPDVEPISGDELPTR